jgi:hypothetical protein
MASEFVNDFKKPVALIALIVASLALAHTIYYQYEQNRRWDALNMGRIDITDMGFVAFRTMTKDEILRTDWGFKPTFSYSVDDGVLSDKIKILFQAVLWDTVRDEPANRNAYLTASEARLAIERLKLNPDSTAIYLYYSVYFKVKNTGVSGIKNVRFTMISNLKNEVRLSKENQRIDRDQSIEYLPGKTGVLNYGFYVPLDKTLPDIITFDVKASYIDIHGKPFSKTFSYKTNSVNNDWEFVSSQAKRPSRESPFVSSRVTARGRAAGPLCASRHLN